jgi:hypothetical protein
MIFALTSTIDALPVTASVCVRCGGKAPSPLLYARDSARHRDVGDWFRRKLESLERLDDAIDGLAYV